MGRKAVDSRIPALIRNNLQEKKRSFFVIVGDHAKDTIVHLNFIMNHMSIQNKSILWAYSKKLLGFTSHRQKRENKIKKEIKRGIREANDKDAFELFVSLHNIRYVYYKETEKILGNTYGVCVLQDMEAITPNILARTIETVEGGGLVILLLKGMNSLKQLYTLSMDVHSRYRTEAYSDVTARFMERFILSLGSNDSCLVIDDEMNVLPISGARGVKPLPPPELDQPKSESEKQLDELKESLQDTEPVGSLIKLTKTTDQAKALLTFVDAIAEKTLKSTVTLTAARGRGKSAAMGIAVAAAVAHGYSNIFISSPSPENLTTLWSFIFKGFDALGYQDHHDYSILQSVNPDFNKAIVRVNIYRNHRQTIQYIRPTDAHVLGQAELVVVDEAAAIPLPVVKKLITGPYLVFVSSTINGYEGTGRSLSLKLIKQLREQSSGVGAKADTSVADRSTGKASKDQDASSLGGRTLREITLSEPVRYAAGDSVEKWLNTLLCLDATLPQQNLESGCPDPEKCELLNVNRDVLFSFHPVSERFLQSLVAIYVSSHYKNTPDDLQLLSDAPAHELYVLVPPITGESNTLPEPLCVVQVALEGKISRQSVQNSLSRGNRPAGDLIPWLVSQQFQDDEFAGLSGARVVRIATNPNYVAMGYGSKALELLTAYYERKFTNLSEGSAIIKEKTIKRVTDAELANSSLLDDDIKVRDISKMPPFFAKLTERQPVHLDYLGVSYGLTKPLMRFWKRAQFAPVYLRQTANDLTGEHTCVMLRGLSTTPDRTWLGAFSRDFERRFHSLLSYQFRKFECVLAMSIDEAAQTGARLDETTPSPLTKSELDALLSPFDRKRLESYANSLLDYHVILDLLPTIANLYFSGRLKSGIKLSPVQQSILLAVGLQRKTVEEVSDELPLPVNQLLSTFTKITRKVTAHFASLVEKAVEAELPERKQIGVSRANATGMHDDKDGVNGANGAMEVDERFEPLEQPLDADLEEGGDEVMAEMRRKQKELIDSLPLDQYEIEGDAPGWDEAEKQVANATKSGKASTVVSVKSGGKASKRKAEKGGSAAEMYEQEFGEKAKMKKHKKLKR